MSTPPEKQTRPGVAAGTDPSARPSRRVFSPEFKLAIIAEYESDGI